MRRPGFSRSGRYLAELDLQAPLPRVSRVRRHRQNVAITQCRHRHKTKILALVSPDSFSGFSPWSDRAWDSEWLYFSFVTMTTLGYGDILPVSATARSLAYLQAIFGQFYIAVLVAGLVSVYVSKKGEK